MRRIVVNLFIVLAATGLLVGFGGPLGLEQGITRLLSLIHYWGGLLFLVMFPLYAWDHIGRNRRWLRRLRLVTLSGELQTAAAALLMLSGLLLIAYGVQAWGVARSVHHWLTYPMALSIVLHKYARKRWK